jgi:hypothetical protein
LTAKQTMILMPDANAVSVLMEYLLKQLPNLAVSVKRHPITGMFAVRFPTTKGVESCDLPTTVPRMMGSLSYQENYLVVVTARCNHLFRLWLDMDTVYSTADADKLATALVPGYQGEAGAELAFIMPATSLNDRPIRVGTNCEIV